MSRIVFFTLSSLLALSACSSPTARLEVRVVTGLVPGPEFRSVQTDVFASTHAAAAYASSEALARFGDDYARGREVSALDLPAGDYRVRVRLVRPNGTLLVERTVVLNFAGDTILPVHITRDCVGVVCPSPGGSAELTTCLAGRCVDPACSVQRPELCPQVTFCHDAAQCTTPASCATVLCDEGVCTPSPIPASCGVDEWCNPDTGAGCVPTEPIVDGPGVACGTICTDPSRPCEFGYWNCSGDADPFCDPLLNRPVGFVCGDGLACDAQATCVGEAPPQPGIAVTPTAGLVTTEGGDTATFSVALQTEPSATVFLILSSSSVNEATVSPGSLAFSTSNWNVAQVVTVTGVDDAVTDGNQPFTIVTNALVSTDADYGGLDVPDVTGLNVDDESPGVLITPTSGLVTSEDGGTDTFSVLLQARPTADVSFTLSSSDTNEGTVSPALLTFTTSNWSVPQTVTVSGVDDADLDDAQPYTIVTSPATSTDVRYGGLAISDVDVANIDNDIASVVVTPTSGLVTQEFGTTAAFTVVLDSPPTANATVSFASSNEAEATVSPSSIVFTAMNWSTPRTVTVTGVDDALLDGDQTLVIVTSDVVSADDHFDGLNVADVEVTNEDDDTPGVTVTPTTGLATNEAGATATFSVVLESHIDSTVTIALSSSNTSEGTVSPSGLTFTPLNWHVPQIVTVTGIPDHILDGHTPYGIITGAAVSAVAEYSGLAVDDVQLANRSLADPPTYIKGPQSVAMDYYGASVELSDDGSTLVVSALGESSSSTGIGGSDVDSAAPQSGAVYVYARSGTSWVLQAYIKSSNSQAGDSFGARGAVDISADGNVLAVGAPGEDSNAVGVGGDQTNNGAGSSGAAYVFTRSGSTWSQQAYIKASNTRVNHSFGVVALSADGLTLAVGAGGEGSNATGIGGDQLNNSALNSGAVYVFTRSGSVWTQQQYIKASNTRESLGFGASLCLSSDGNTLVAATVLDSSSATGIDGNPFDTGAPYSGAVFVFVRVGTTWSQQAYVKASNTRATTWFGYSTALSSDGNTLAVGSIDEASASPGINGNQMDASAPGAGAVYVFTRAGTVWSQQAYVKSSFPIPAYYFGYSIDLSSNGNALVVSSPGSNGSEPGFVQSEGPGSTSASGSAFLFRRSGTVWTQITVIKASDPSMGDLFGTTAAISGDGNLIVAGADQEDSAGTGIGGAMGGSAEEDSGAVYSYVEPP